LPQEFLGNGFSHNEVIHKMRPYSFVLHSEPVRRSGRGRDGLPR